MLYDKGLLLADIEAAFGVAETLSESTDAFEVIDPQYTADFSKLDRRTITGTKSPNRMGIGRKIGSISFNLEVKGNGGITAGRLGRLLKACDMTETQITASTASLFSRPAPFGNPTGTGVFSSMTPGGTYTTPGADNSSIRRVLLTCTLAGASGVCKFTVRAEASGSEAATTVAEAVMTSNSPFTLVGGATITPVFSGSFALGDKYVIYLASAGYKYTPRSESDTEGGHSLTMKLYFDGLVHELTGARGTWSMQAGAGEYAMFSFQFTGDYHEAVDAAVPSSPVFETTQPPQVEKSRLWLPKSDGTQNQSLCAAQFGFAMGNGITGRRCVNNENGYAGAKITQRQPQFTADPEMLVEADHGFWELFETALTYDVMAVVAETDATDDLLKGQAVAFVGPQAQTSSMPYANRDNTRVANLTASLARIVADDELCVVVF